MFFFENKFKVAETYIKLDLEYDINNIEKINKTLEKIAIQQRKEFKHIKNVSIVIDYDEGSLKAKIQVYGMLTIAGLIFYGEIREGIDYAYNDAKWFSENVILQSKNENQTIDVNYIRGEKRTGLIGRLKRTLDRIDYLERNLNNLGNNQVQDELLILRSDLVSIIALLSFEERQTFINALPHETRDNLPDENPEKTQHFLNLYALKPDDIIIIED